MPGIQLMEANITYTGLIRAAVCDWMASAWTRAGSPRGRSTSFALSQRYRLLSKFLTREAATIKPGIKSVLSSSNLLPSTEKSQGQAVNTADGLGWASQDVLLPEVRGGALTLCQGHRHHPLRGRQSRKAPAHGVLPPSRARACHSIFYSHSFGL